MKPLQARPTLSLPPAAYPQRRPAPPPQQPPAPKAEAPAPKPKPPPELDVAERVFGEAMRDNARITLTFLDGEQITVRPVAIGRYSFLIETSESEEVIFKAALRSLRLAK
jgi:hypothetical protein